MKFKFLKAIFAGIMLTLTTFAYAGLITDTPNESFIDETSGIEWLDFEVNLGRTYAEVLTDMELGGAYFGWSIASGAQTLNMFKNVFHPIAAEIYSSSSTVESGRLLNDHPLYTEYLATIGYTFTHGLLIINHSDNDWALFEQRDGWFDYYLVNNDTGHSIGGSSGWFLVREVPEPATLAIFAIGLMGLGLRRKKRV